MARITVLDFEVGDDAVHLWEHGLTNSSLFALLHDRYIVRPNRAGRTAPYLFIGFDEQGQCWALPIVPTDDPYVWRPIAAWPCKPQEFDWLWKSR